MAMGSRYFDGANDKLGPASWTFPGYPFTMAAWCTYPTRFEGDQYIVSYHNAGTPAQQHYLMATRTDTGATWRAGSYEALGSQGIASWTNRAALRGKWHHIVGVWADTDSRKLYVNGVLRDTDAVDIDITPVNVYVGANVATAYFRGNLSHVSLWSAELNAVEVAVLYQGASPAKTRSLSLAAYWKIHGMASPEPNHYGTVGSLAVSGAVAQGTGPKVIAPSW